MKKIIAGFCTVVLLLLSGCSLFQSNHFNAYDKQVIKAKTGYNYALYLEKNGTLYSPGSIDDAGDYILFLDETNGIVAENVRDFGTMSWGGYYIDNQNDLYIFNHQRINLYQYKPSDRFKKILNDIKCAYVTNDDLYYQDMNGDLFFAGIIDGREYSLDEHTKVGENVSCQDYDYWIENDNTLHTFSNRITDTELVAAANENMKALPDVTKMKVSNECILLLADKELWYIGDIDYLKQNGFELQDRENKNIVSVKLADDIVDFDANAQTIAAVKSDGTAFGWGKLLMNGDTEQQKPIIEYHDDAVPLNISDVESVHVGGDEHITFVTKEHHTKVFTSNDFGFCGNSTENEFIGVKSTPKTWVNPDQSKQPSSSSTQQV